MARINRLTHLSGTLLQRAMATHHGRTVLLGLSAGLVYLPAWSGYLTGRALKGKIGWFLVVSMLAFVGFQLWNKQSLLRKLKASEEDRLLGHLLIFSGVVLFFFCRFALWSQALLWLVILIGIALSTWGAGVFAKFVLPFCFVALTVYPRIGLISRSVWEFVTPYQGLEKAMAWAGSLGMRSIGFSAVPEGVFITFPEGVVEVGWGCNGLDMAITIAATGLFMGLLYKQKRSQMVLLIVTAAAIVMLANIPRLMLVTIASVYWGPWWFNFWHGFWGGQIFSGLLLTIYYYVVMALVNRKPQSTGHRSEH